MLVVARVSECCATCGFSEHAYSCSTVVFCTIVGRSWLLHGMCIQDVFCGRENMRYGYNSLVTQVRVENILISKVDVYSMNTMAMKLETICHPCGRGSSATSDA